jgi:hypothetical protein
MIPPADTERSKHHRFPGAMISHGVWLYYRFTLSGFVNLLRPKRSSTALIVCLVPAYAFSSPRRARDGGPALASWPHLLPGGRRRPQMPSWSAVVDDGAIRRQKPLGMPGGLAPLPAICPLAGGPRRVLTPGMEVPTLAMFHPGDALALGRAIALQLLGDDDARHGG